MRRCGPPALAEDLTAETFLAAVDAVRGSDPPSVTLPWIMGVARHKLVDHWRRQGCRLGLPRGQRQADRHGLPYSGADFIVR